MSILSARLARIAAEEEARADSLARATPEHPWPPHCCPLCGFVPIEGMDAYVRIHGEKAKCVLPWCGAPLPARHPDHPFAPVGTSEPDASWCSCGRPEWDHLTAAQLAALGNA